MKRIQLRKEFFEGEVSLRYGEGWLQPLRLREEDIPLHNEGLVDQATTASGCRLRFSTTANSVTLTVEQEQSDRLFDLTTDDKLIATATLPAGENHVTFSDLPCGSNVLEIYNSISHIKQ